MDMDRCYGCDVRIGFLRALRPLERTFESAFDGSVHAAFCSVPCLVGTLENAEKVRAMGFERGAPGGGAILLSRLAPVDPGPEGAPGA